MLCTVRIRRIEGRTFNAKSDWVEFEIVGLSKPSRASDIRQSSPRNGNPLSRSVRKPRTTVGSRYLRISPVRR